MSRMAIALLALALVGTAACENLSGWGTDDETPVSQSSTSGGATSGSRGRHGSATGAPRTSNSNRSSPGDLTKQGTIPGEDMLN